MKMSFGLRTWAALLSALLLVVPFAGYRLTSEYRTQLIAAQSDTLLATARTIAAAVDHASEPDIRAALAPTVFRDANHDLYAYALPGPVTLDGRDDDWQCCTAYRRHYGIRDTLAVYQHYTEDSLNFDLLVGERKDAVFLFLKVIDNHVVYREIGSLSVHRNDQIQFATTDSSGTLTRYTIAALQPGPTHPLLVADADDGSRAIRQVPEIDAMWLATESGYNVEVRIPRAMLSNRFAISITDVDDTSDRQPVVTLGSASTRSAASLGTLRLPSRPLAERLRALNARGAAMKLIDSHHRVIASTGDISITTGPWQPGPAEAMPSPGGPADLLASVFAPLLPTPNPSIVDDSGDPGDLQSPGITAALAGRGIVTSHLSSDGTAMVLAATSPIRIEGKTVGAIVIEESTNGVKLLVHNLLARTLAIGMLVALGGAALLIAVAWLLSLRLNRLRHLMDTGADAQGRIRAPVTGNWGHDEIGELGRSLSQLTGRLHQYNEYLEEMSRRLAHELRTPITVIRSSLDNLGMQQLDDASGRYVSRANEGVERLAAIITNMTEASRSEESMNSSDQEYFDLAEVVSGCVQGYEIAYPDQAFELSIEDEFDRLSGLPELIAQMLDKLVGNAVEFSHPGQPVRIRLTLEDRQAVLRVINSGPRLADDVEGRLFDAMISVRRDKDSTESHLGLGLYIAGLIADFHGGTIEARSREDAEGVMITVRLPTMRITANN